MTDKTSSDQAAAQPTPETDPDTITLDYPLARGAQTIKAIALRKPSLRTLSGISLIQVRMGDSDAIGKLLPRITEPPLTHAECDALDPADLGQLSERIGVFFLTRAQLEKAEKG